MKCNTLYIAINIGKNERFWSSDHQILNEIVCFYQFYVQSFTLYIYTTFDNFSEN